jgi:hypothetical protein
MARLRADLLEGGGEPTQTTPVITESAKLTEPDLPTPITDNGYRGSTTPNYFSTDAAAAAADAEQESADSAAALAANAATLGITEPTGPASGSTLSTGATAGTGATGGTGPVNPLNIDFAAALSNLNNQFSNAVSGLQSALSAQNNQLYSMLATQQAEANKTKQQQITNWKVAGQQLLDQYGIGQLGAKYIDFITNQGMDQNTALLELQTTDEWKQRFSANESRLKQGLPVLSPADYLATEASYKDIMIKAGLPASVINDTGYLGQLIAKDVSPVEVQQRVDAARAALNAEDPFVKQQLQAQFGLTTGDLTMHLLDPSVASNIIQQKVTAAQIGAEAEKQRTDISAQNAQALAAQGITQAQAQQGFMAIGQQLPATQALAQRYGANAPTLGVGGALQAATFGTAGGAQAEQELARLRTQELAAFSGSSGAGKGSLGISDTSGLQ